MRRMLISGLLTLTLGATGARSEKITGDTLSTTPLNDTIVVTANRCGLTAAESVWPTTVVNMDHAGRQTSFQQALSGLGGLDLRQSTGVGSVATLSNWGAFNRHLLLLYNGRVVRDYSIGGFSLGEFSPDEFERIELLKGPQSAFYGSDAVGGVVNLITRSALADRATFTTRHGSFDHHQYRLDASRRIGSIGLGSFIEHERAANARPNSGTRRLLAGLRSDYLSRDGQHCLSLSGRYFSDTLGTPGPQLDSAESSYLHDNQTDRNYSVDAAYHLATPALGELQLDLFHESKRLTFTMYPDNAASNYSYRSTTYKRSSGLSARLSRQRTRISTSGGIDWLSGSVRNESSGDYISNNWSHDQNQFDLWSDLAYELSSAVRVDISGRLQFTRHRRTQPSYNAGLVFSPANRLRLKLGYGYAFRLPSISDQFSVEPYNMGNPKLNPETSRTLVASVAYAFPDRRYTFEVTYFDQRVDSLIRYVPILVTSSAESARLQSPLDSPINYINIDRFVSHGVDLGVTLRPYESFSLALGGVYQRARQTNDRGEFITAHYVPNLKWRADLDFRPTPGLSANLNLIHTSDRHLLIWGLYPKRIAAVYTIGVAVTTRLSSFLWVSLIAEDLTDQKRPDQFGFSTTDRDYPSLGRRLTLELRASLL